MKDEIRNDLLSESVKDIDGFRNTHGTTNLDEVTMREF
jgi:hypothetical protein